MNLFKEHLMTPHFRSAILVKLYWPVDTDGCQVEDGGSAEHDVERHPRVTHDLSQEPHAILHLQKQQNHVTPNIPTSRRANVTRKNRIADVTSDVTTQLNDRTLLAWRLEGGTYNWCDSLTYYLHYKKRWDGSGRNPTSQLSTTSSHRTFFKEYFSCDCGASVPVG